MATRKEDVEALVAEGAIDSDSGIAPYAEMRAALDNLVTEIKAATKTSNHLGLKVNVALRVADAVLKRYPRPNG